MTDASAMPRGPTQVEARLRFLASAEAGATYIASVGGGEVRPHQGNFVEQPVAVHNARLREAPFSLDREGFLLVGQTSAVGDFYDDDAIAGIYEEEVRSLLRWNTGARRVEVFDHTRRAASDTLRKARMIREPAAVVHNDYTADSGPRRLKEHFAHAPQEADALLAGRFAIVNVWRSISGTVRSAPLALCDASSTTPDDLVPVTRQAKDRTGQIQMALYNPAQRWYYFPAMTMNEALLIKTYDSETGGRARFTIHTSFSDPSTPPDAPPRESLETRCFVFF